MSLVHQIRDEAIDPTNALGTVLRRCRVLAAELPNERLEQWLVWESNGYPMDAELPKYRTWRLDVTGSFVGPFGAQLRHAPIPFTTIPVQFREDVVRYGCRQSVAGIEESLKSDEKGMFAVNLGDWIPVFGSGVFVNYSCVEMWGQFGTGFLVEVLNKVRNRVLDFALALDKEFPDVGEPTARGRAAPERVQQIVNMIFHGDASGIVGAVNASTVGLNVTPGDTESLLAALRDLNLSEVDRKELGAAVVAEPTPAADGKFGPRVSSWIGRMAGKAASGALKVGTEVAVPMISKAIAKYYGLEA